jgi:hypothetical protein
MRIAGATVSQQDTGNTSCLKSGLVGLVVLVVFGVVVVALSVWATRV